MSVVKISMLLLKIPLLVFLSFLQAALHSLDTLFPGLQQFSGFGRGSIPAPPGKIRRSERLKFPIIAPKNYRKKGERVCLECRRK